MDWCLAMGYVNQVRISAYFRFAMLNHRKSVRIQRPQAALARAGPVDANFLPYSAT